MRTEFWKLILQTAEARSKRDQACKAVITGKYACKALIMICLIYTKADDLVASDKGVFMLQMSTLLL